MRLGSTYERFYTMTKSFSNNSVEILAKQIASATGMKHTEALREARYAIHVRFGRAVELLPNNRNADVFSDADFDFGWWKSGKDYMLRWCEDVVFKLPPVKVGSLTAQWTLQAPQGPVDQNALTNGSAYISLTLVTSGHHDSLVFASVRGPIDYSGETEEEDRKQIEAEQTFGSESFEPASQEYISDPVSDSRIADVWVTNMEFTDENTAKQGYDQSTEDYKGFAVTGPNKAQSIIDGLIKSVSAK